MRDTGGSVLFSGSWFVHTASLVTSGPRPDEEADYHCHISNHYPPPQGTPVLWGSEIKICPPHPCLTLTVTDASSALASAFTCAVESRDPHVFILVHLYGVSENVSIPYWSLSTNTMTVGPDTNDPSQVQGRMTRKQRSSICALGDPGGLCQPPACPSPGPGSVLLP